MEAYMKKRKKIVIAISVILVTIIMVLVTIIIVIFKDRFSTSMDKILDENIINNVTRIEVDYSTEGNLSAFTIDDKNQISEIINFLMDMEISGVKLDENHTSILELGKESADSSYNINIISDNGDIMIQSYVTDDTGKKFIVNYDRNAYYISNKNIYEILSRYNNIETLSLNKLIELSKKDKVTWEDLLPYKNDAPYSAIWRIPVESEDNEIYLIIQNKDMKAETDFSKEPDYIWLFREGDIEHIDIRDKGLDSFLNKQMDNSLLDVRGINHKYIVVEWRKYGEYYCN